MIARFAGGFALGLAFAACGDPGVTACVARCQTFAMDATLCQTMCTRSCPELRASFGIDEDTCKRIQTGTVDHEPAAAPATPPPPPPPPATPDLTARCADFVAFTFGCGIGRPPPDPTVSADTQRNNQIVIQQGVIAQCQRRQPPYDEALIRCFDSAAPDCEVYEQCADAAVKVRPRGP